MIIDKIELNNDKLFAIGRVLENENYVKKIFSLENDNKKYNSYILKEIKFVDLDNNNSRVTPIKICTNKNEGFVLCIDDNNLLKEINENKNKIQTNNECEIAILNNSQENNDIEKIIKFYNSDNINKIMKLFSFFTDENITKFVEAFNAIKGVDNEVLTEDITYNDFIQYLKGKNEMENLFLFFIKNEGNEYIFKYLKNRISLIENNFLIYVNINLKSKEFFQEIILKNTIYLTEKIKMEYFNNLLYYNDVNNEEFSIYRNKINIDRFKAKAFYDKYNENSEKSSDKELNETIFGQLFHHFENINGRMFLKAKGERLFGVELNGEQAIDVGGPYHEVISCMCEELQSNYIDLFIKTPNNKTNSGKLRDRYMINPDSKSNIYKKACEFIGKLMVMTISTGESLNLNLHPIIWKKILEQEITFDEYESIDIFYFNTINQLKEAFNNKNKEILNSFDLIFAIKNSNESDIELKENGKEINVNLENLEEYINLAKLKRLIEIDNQIDCIKKGIYSAIDKNVLQLLNWKQLEEMVCGKNKLDINDFKGHTKYHGYKGDEEIIKWVWDWLISSKEEEQFKYLKFVSGRTRLPKSRFGFDYTHIITKVSKNNVYPRSSTCFFTLKLPNYDSKNIFIEKMKYAIENCSGISDY